MEASTPTGPLAQKLPELQALQSANPHAKTGPNPKILNSDTEPDEALDPKTPNSDAEPHEALSNPENPYAPCP